MRNIYNKGKYRNGEWAKHLRPFLKKTGNRKWRADAIVHIQTDWMVDDQPDQALEKTVSRVSRKQKKKVKVKITSSGFNGHIRSTIKKFHSQKAMQNSIARSNVLRYYIYKAI